MTRAIEKESWMKATGAHSVRMTRRGAMTTMPAGAQDLPEPTLKEMLNENRKQRKKLMKRQRRGEDVTEALEYIRRRARWIKHEMRRVAQAT